MIYYNRPPVLKAKLFENNAQELVKNNYLVITLTGSQLNLQAIGSKVFLYTKGKTQMLELNPYRGYESTVELPLYFGLGKNAAADSIIITLPDGNIQKQYGIIANQRINIRKPLIKNEEQRSAGKKTEVFISRNYIMVAVIYLLQQGVYRIQLPS